jgi:hypothetical protein
VAFEKEIRASWSEYEKAAALGWAGAVTRQQRFNAVKKVLQDYQSTCGNHSTFKSHKETLNAEAKTIQKETDRATLLDRIVAAGKNAAPLYKAYLPFCKYQIAELNFLVDVARVQLNPQELYAKYVPEVGGKPDTDLNVNQSSLQKLKKGEIAPAWGEVRNTIAGGNSITDFLKAIEVHEL